MRIKSVKFPDGRVIDANQDMLVEYTGQSTGIVKYRGPSTAVYRFSSVRKTRTVCTVDAAWFARQKDFVVKELPSSEE